MKLLFGADAIRYPLTGIGRYAWELCMRLPQTPEVEEMLYFRDGAVADTLPNRPSSDQHTTLATSGLRRYAAHVPLLLRAYAKYMRMTQAKRLASLKGHLFHGPNYYLPNHEGPCVATFHDLSVFLWPQCHPEIRVRHMSNELPIAARRANVLITDSEFNRRETADYFGLSLDKVVSAPLAAAEEFRPMSAIETYPSLVPLGLTHGAYALFVGTLDPRKNIDILLDVYEKMPDNMRKRVPLVIVGFEGWKSEATIKRLRAGEAAGWARYPGFVTENALPALYAGARVFLYPSRYEGFGLPVLEAMQAGVPVICSNAACLPEVAGPDGAILLDPDNFDDLYNSVQRAIDDDQWCMQAAQRGVTRAKHFSWEKTVSATLAAYALAIRS